MNTNTIQKDGNGWQVLDSDGNMVGYIDPVCLISSTRDNSCHRRSMKHRKVIGYEVQINDSSAFFFPRLLDEHAAAADARWGAEVEGTDRGLGRSRVSFRFAFHHANLAPLPHTLNKALAYAKQYAVSPDEYTWMRPSNDRDDFAWLTTKMIDLTKTGPDRIAAVATLKQRIADLEATTTPETITDEEVAQWSNMNLDLAHLLDPNKF